MPVFKYTATTGGSREEHMESGTVIAEDEERARKKLKALRLDRIGLRRISGLMGIIKRFTADIK